MFPLSGRRRQVPFRAGDWASYPWHWRGFSEDRHWAIPCFWLYQSCHRWNNTILWYRRRNCGSGNYIRPETRFPAHHQVRIRIPRYAYLHCCVRLSIGRYRRWRLHSLDALKPLTSALYLSGGSSIVQKSLKNTDQKAGTTKNGKDAWREK